MAETAAKKAPNELHAALNKQLAAEARTYRLHWDPASFRAYLQRELARNIAEMREQRLARIRRRDDLLAWLIQYENWREENGRPIAYCRRAPAPAEEAKAA